MKLRVPLLLLGLVTSACLVADCGGDDTGDSTGTGGSAGKAGGGGSAGHGGGSAGSIAGSAGSLAGVGGFAGSVGGSGGFGGSAGAAGLAGAAGSAGAAGAPKSDAGDGAAGSAVDAGLDAAKEAGVDATSSTDVTTSSDGTTGADAADATNADVSTSVDASDAASSDATDAGVGALVINEIVSNPIDYVEFYNKGGAPIDISNWYFTDNNPDGGSDHFYFFPAGTIVPSHGFYLATAAADAGTHFMTVGLGSADSVILRDNLGNLIEQESWTDHRLGDSRCPDGTGIFNNPDGGTNNRPQTPGAPNSCQ